MTGDLSLSHLRAEVIDSYFGASIAGMPSFGGPPPRNSARSTLAFVKSVFQPEVETRSRLGSAEREVLGVTTAVVPDSRDDADAAPPVQATTISPVITSEIQSADGLTIPLTVGM